MPSSLIVFDLDGTLIDSRRDLADSANELLAAHGHGPLPVEEIGAMVGDGARLLIARTLRRAGLDIDVAAALQQFFDIYDRRLLVHTTLYPGVADLLARASALAQLAVLTNKPSRFNPPILHALGIADRFAEVIGGDDPRFPRKPDPASTQHLMRQAGVDAGATLFVGDSMVDVETARRAGVRMCVATYGFGQTRGDMALAGDELIAAGPEDLSPIVEDFVRYTRNS